jgi:hypothetical protein
MTTSRCASTTRLWRYPDMETYRLSGGEPGMSPCSGREATSTDVALCRRRHQTRTGQPFSGSNAGRHVPDPKSGIGAQAFPGKAGGGLNWNSIRIWQVLSAQRESAEAV